MRFTISQITTRKLMEMMHLFPKLNPDQVVRKALEELQKSNQKETP